MGFWAEFCAELLSFVYGPQATSSPPGLGGQGFQESWLKP